MHELFDRQQYGPTGLPRLVPGSICRRRIHQSFNARDILPLFVYIVRYADDICTGRVFTFLLNAKESLVFPCKRMARPDTSCIRQLAYFNIAFNVYISVLTLTHSHLWNASMPAME